MDRVATRGIGERTGKRIAITRQTLGILVAPEIPRTLVIKSKEREGVCVAPGSSKTLSLAIYLANEYVNFTAKRCSINCVGFAAAKEAKR